MGTHPIFESDFDCLTDMSQKPVSISLPWQLAFAAASGCGATILVQPMDLVKNRMQTNKGLGVGQCVKSVIATDGIRGMWTGLSAGLLRQCTCTTVRLGVYRKMEESYKPDTFAGKLGMGKIIKNEGVLSLWSGFMPYYLRLGPHTVLAFIFLEQIKNLYLKTFYGAK